jgi:hypothetical protein
VGLTYALNELWIEFPLGHPQIQQLGLLTARNKSEKSKSKAMDRLNGQVS